MGRRENELEPGAGALARFAADLRELRRAAGNPSYRDLAKRAHYSHNTLSTAASGRVLPSKAVALAFVAACGGDQAAWRERWQQLEQELAGTGGALAGPQVPAVADTPCPVPRQHPGAAEDVLRYWAGMPLALAIFAARAGMCPELPLQDMAAELRADVDRLDVLEPGDGGLGLRAVFSGSVRALSPGAAELLALLALSRLKSDYANLQVLHTRAVPHARPRRRRCPAACAGRPGRVISAPDETNANPVSSQGPPE